MAKRSVGKRSVKRKAPRTQEVNLFNFADDVGGFEDESFVDDVNDVPDIARTTEDLTTIAITVPLAGVAIGTLGTL